MGNAFTGRAAVDQQHSPATNDSPVPSKVGFAVEQHCLEAAALSVSKKLLLTWQQVRQLLKTLFKVVLRNLQFLRRDPLHCM